MGELTRAILDPVSPVSTLRPEVLQLAELLQASAGFAIDPSGGIDRGESRRAGGLALSPTMAVMCAADYARTVVFLRGLHEAIGSVLERYEADPSQPVRVLDAGCGPLALLSVPLMAVLPDRVRFTLIDTHADSLVAVERLLATLGLASRVDAVRCEDATTCQIERAHQPDVVVTETMQACLEKEPQVAISRHLLVQAPGAVLVPESVRIDAVLVDPAAEFGLDQPVRQGEVATPQRRHQRLDTLFELSAQTIAQWAHLKGESLPGHTVRLPDPIPRGMQPMLFTEIRVFGSHTLGPHDSGLTIPRAFPVRDSIRDGAVFESRYRLGDRPGLVIEPASEPQQVGPPPEV